MAARARSSEARTERLIEELLSAQGWDLRRPPQGEVLAQHEYRDFPQLRDALASAGKRGAGGHGVPEYVLVDRTSLQPVGVIEGKASVAQIDAAVAEVEGYADALRAAWFSPLAIAVAGTADERFSVRVRKWTGSEWRDLTYEGEPISWIPDPKTMERIRTSTGFELRPEIPPSDVLRARADEINGLLRESGLKDDFRPAAIGAIMLGLWRSGGDIRRSHENILPDINRACERAFNEAGKPVLARSLHVDEANERLAARAPRICDILERLNITTLTAEHDYLGALYEEFFRYTGGNTIGQYFTPRHVAGFVAELCKVTATDVVLDPACGTGGFLIAAMDRMQRESRLTRKDVVHLVKRQLIGLESEPVTAALCVANMILRGDGSTGVKRTDCFADADFPFGAASVVLMNPPFPHKKTDTPPTAFVERALEGLQHRGLAGVIVPSSLLVKRTLAEWRRSVLQTNTLLAVVSFPSDLFQPYAAATTAVLLFEKGVPHREDHPVFFASVSNDGYRLKKGVRIPQSGSQLAPVIRHYREMTDVPEFCGTGRIEEASGWAPGAYIPAKALTDTEVMIGVGELVRNRLAFVVKHAPAVARLQARSESGHPPLQKRGGNLEVKPERLLPPGAIGRSFHIRYGQKQLHNKEGLEPGSSLVISSSGLENGCYGFFEFPDVLKPPFVTVPSTGSIGEASVQEFPCGVTDDCLLLIPKSGTPREALYIAAATLRAERWRFDYGRKMTPARIAAFPMAMNQRILSAVRSALARADSVVEPILDALNSRGELR